CVAGDRVAADRVAVSAVHRDAVPGVVANLVAYDLVVRRQVDVHAAVEVAHQGVVAVGVGADAVVLDAVAGGGFAFDPDADEAVGGDEVSGDTGATDGVVRRVLDEDAVDGIAQGGGAGSVGADVVALHAVVSGTSPLDPDAVSQVA